MNEYHWTYANTGNIRLKEMWYGNVQVSGAMFHNYPCQFMTPVTGLVPPELFQNNMVLRVDTFAGREFIVEFAREKVYIGEWTKSTKVTADNHVIFDGLRELPVCGAILLNADCSFSSVVLQEDFMNIRLPENGHGVLFYGKTCRGFKGCSQAEVNDLMREYLPDRKIQAIKSFRKYTGMELKASKDIIDRVLAVMYNTRYSAYYKK